MTSPRVLAHTSVQPMRWADMDALGHVNNTVNFRYMEQARSYYDRHGRGTKHADGVATIVWIDLAAGRSTPLPDVLLAPLRAAAE